VNGERALVRIYWLTKLGFGARGFADPPCTTNPASCGFARSPPELGGDWVGLPGSLPARSCHGTTSGVGLATLAVGKKIARGCDCFHGLASPTNGCLSLARSSAANGEADDAETEEGVGRGLRYGLRAAKDDRCVLVGVAGLIQVR
jgi:hypothetical protein